MKQQDQSQLEETAKLMLIDVFNRHPPLVDNF